MGGFLGNVQAGQVFGTPLSPAPVQPTTAQVDQIGTQQKTVVAQDANAGENQAVAKSAVVQNNQLPGFQQLGLPANGTTSQAATTGTLVPPAAFVSAVTKDTQVTRLADQIGEQVAQAAPADSTTVSAQTKRLAAQIGEQPASTIVPTDGTTQLTTQVKKILPDAIGENATGSANASTSSTNAGPILPPIR